MTTPTGTRHTMTRRGWLFVLAGGIGAACAAPTTAPTSKPATAPSPSAPPPAAAASPSAPLAPPAAAPTTSAPKPAPETKAPTTAKTGPAGRVVFAEDVSTVRMLEAGVGNSGQALHHFWPAFDAMTWMDKEGAVKPGLAREWRNTNETTWEFKLGDYKFHNGRAVEATDVVESYARYRDPQNRLAVAAAFTSVDKVEGVDPKTIRITTKYPDPTLPNLMSLPLILPMKEHKEIGATEFTRRPIGTGQYKVEQADFSTAVKFSAMGPEFPTPRGTPSIKDVEVRFINEPAARAAALQTGEVDITIPLNDDQAPALEQAGFKVIRQAATSTVHFLLDPLNPPTNDVRVRHAINYAIDKETIIKQLYNGNARVDQQIIGPGCLGFNPELKPYAFDRAKARQLLAEAGYASGFTLPMTVLNISTASKELGEVLAAQLKEVGISVNIEVREVAIWVQEYYGTRDKRKGIWAEVINWDQTFEPNSTWRWYSTDVPVDGGRRWDDQTFDKMYQAAKTTFDRSRREQLYVEAGKYFYEQAPVLFLWQPFRPGAMKKDLSWDATLVADSYYSKLIRA